MSKLYPTSLNIFNTIKEKDFLTISNQGYISFKKFIKNNNKKSDYKEKSIFKKIRLYIILLFLQVKLYQIDLWLMVRQENS